MIKIRIQKDVFSADREEAELRLHGEDWGALVAFQGVVRGRDHERPMTHLYLEHFPEVSESHMERIVRMAF